MAERLKLIVLDDDPTGSQTVHSCPLLLRWDAASLRQGLAHSSPLLFVLTNTRALEPATAQSRVREVCQTLRPLLLEARANGWFDHWMVVSRGDSTLRGHFPLEADVIEAELGPFDIKLLAPAFLPGGRTTVDGIHLLHGEPVHQSDYAQDRLFGFSTSALNGWVEQKTCGRIRASAVGRITAEQLDAAASSEQGQHDLVEWLHNQSDRAWLSVDAERQQQLEGLGAAVRLAIGAGQRLMAQSAASLLNGLVPLPAQPQPPQALAKLRRTTRHGETLPGLVMVGSHVPLADAQLRELLQSPRCAGVEIPVETIAQALRCGDATQAIDDCSTTLQRSLEAILQRAQTAVLYSQRGEVHCGDPSERRRLGLTVAQLMGNVAANLSSGLGYILSKGGITSHTLLADGLRINLVELKGQLMPGISLLMAKGMPVITVPGNLGDRNTVRLCWRLMEGHQEGR